MTCVSACARITRLSTAPVKGLALHHPDAILLQRTGAAGDREFFVIDGRDRLISIWKTGRLVGFRAAHDTRRKRITLSSSGAVVCDGPTRPGGTRDRRFLWQAEGGRNCHRRPMECGAERRGG
jgi:uncharacterized protein YcbX